MRYFISIKYVGTKYHGWQVQPNATTVQEVLNSKLNMILPQKEIATMGCGRTDAGVHATNFYVHLDLNNEVNAPDIVNSLNKILPEDISVDAMVSVTDDAHARFDALSRTYEYHIHSRKDAFRAERSMLLHLPLDVDAMNDACKLLIGEHDFECFAKTGSDNKTTICTVTEAAWSTDGAATTFRITADRFLRNMVRAIVGTMLEVGTGKMSLEEFREVLSSKDRGEAGRSVAACGLYLVQVRYPYPVDP